MSVNTITNPYTYNEKTANGTLSHEEWNAISLAAATALSKINEIINEGVPSSGGESSGESPYVSFSNEKKNLTIQTTEKKANGKGGKINIEPISDLQIKPGDDIILYSHHRTGNEGEVLVKVANGSNPTYNNEEISDYPVTLQVNASDVTLTAKDKLLTLKEQYRAKNGSYPTSGSDEEEALEKQANVLNINVNKAKGSKGYLKVRAQAIDLRCEEHGGIALLPKGEDSNHNENKIKFEHGGGDGLEFGTFNTEKTSIFTDEYRFNKDGIWKMATRLKVASDKPESGDATTSYKYQKQSDDFYDIISSNDEQCTTKDIIKTAFAMNGVPTIHTKITDKGNLEIATVDKFVLLEKDLESNISDSIGDSDYIDGLHYYNGGSESLVVNGYYDAEEISDCFDVNEPAYIEDPLIEAANGDILYIAEYVEGFMGPGGSPDDIMVFKFKKVSAPSINIESGSKLKLKGILDFGSSFNFGETDKGIEFQKKKTAKNSGNEKDCDKVRVVGINNHSSNVYRTEAISFLNYPLNKVDIEIGEKEIQPGGSVVLAEASMYDIIKLTQYFKTHKLGPWDYDVVITVWTDSTKTTKPTAGNSYGSLYVDISENIPIGKQVVVEDINGNELFKIQNGTSEIVMDLYSNWKCSSLSANSVLQAGIYEFANLNIMHSTLTVPLPFTMYGKIEDITNT